MIEQKGAEVAENPVDTHRSNETIVILRAVANEFVNDLRLSSADLGSPTGPRRRLVLTAYRLM